MRLLRLPSNCLMAIVGIVCLVQFNLSCRQRSDASTEKGNDSSGVAVLLVDTDHPISRIDSNIYGQFLEHINHSVENGLYAEQVQGQGFEGKDFETYWKLMDGKGKVSAVQSVFEKGSKSARISTSGNTAGLIQGRFYIQKGVQYNGSIWIKPESGNTQVGLRIMSKGNTEVAKVSLPYSGSNWQEVPIVFTPTVTDTSANLEISASGSGSVLIDFISIMTADARANGKLRPDLLQSVKALKPRFMRWPGGSFASTYKWQDGIGSAASRVYHPNVMWGGYADYYGFGTDEFLEFCRQLEADPMITLAAPSTKPEDVEYAMNWVHYLLDPATTAWGKLRATNGHAQPYRIPYIQIDNEPMNNNQTPEVYAEIVNVYGSRLRQIAPASKIVACGQKRSNDLNWSQKIIDLSGANFDILGCHNYEYEPENYATGVERISEYLLSLDHFIRYSAHPAIKIAVLEWSLSRAYDWRAGLHAAGSLIAYERLSPALTLTCPALLMRNTTDNPEWRSFIYHDHVSWFPGSGYVAEKLFVDHFAPIQLAATSGTYKPIEKSAVFFDDISQMKPEDWKKGTIDAIATMSDDGKKVIIKAVNYEGVANALLVRFQGKGMGNAEANVKTFIMSAGLKDQPSMEHPDAIKPVEGTAPFKRDMSFKLSPYSIMIIEVTVR